MLLSVDQKRLVCVCVCVGGQRVAGGLLRTLTRHSGVCRPGRREPLEPSTSPGDDPGGVRGGGGVERGRQVSHGWRNTRRWDFSPSLARTPRALIRKTNAGRQTGK